VATGHGDWKALAVDAVLMALPVVGRVASRAVAARRLAGAAQISTHDGASIGQAIGGPLSRAIVDNGKLDYLFGGVRSSVHNAARSAQNIREMSRLGLTGSVHGRSLIENHLQAVVEDAKNIAREYSNEFGTFQVRESLFAGPSGAFSKLESTGS
jgi:filamentous hemagglutinin